MEEVIPTVDSVKITTEDHGDNTRSSISSWGDYYRRLCDHIPQYPSPMLEEIFSLIRNEMIKRSMVPSADYATGSGIQNTQPTSTPKKKKSKPKGSKDIQQEPSSSHDHDHVVDMSCENTQIIASAPEIVDSSTPPISTSQPSTPKKKDPDTPKRKAPESELKEIPAKGRLFNFFSVLKKSNILLPESEVLTTPFDDHFKPFFVKPDVTLSRTKRLGIRTDNNTNYMDALKEARRSIRFSWTSTCDDIKQKLKEHVQLLEEIRLGSYFSPKPVKRAQSMSIMDEDDELNVPKGENSTSQLITMQLPLIRFKLLQFHDNYRPAYFGTWTKYSSKITPRRPFERDHESGMNYDVDSDDEWQEDDLLEEDGVENLSNSDDSDEDEDEQDDQDDDSDKEWVVPHGYLSEGEGMSDDDADDADGKNVEYIKKTGPKMLVPKVIGPVYDNCDSRRYSMYELERLASCSFSFIPMALANGCGIDPFVISYHVVPLSMSRNLLDPQVITEQLPVLSEIARTGGKLDNDGGKEEENLEKGKSDPSQKAVQYQKFNDDLVNTLATMLHGSYSGLSKIYSDFKEKVGMISKRQFEFKVFEIATKEKRPPNMKLCWYIKDEYLQRFGLNVDPIVDQLCAIEKSESTSKPVVSRRRITPQMIAPINNDVKVVISPPYPEMHDQTMKSESISNVENQENQEMIV